VMWSRPAKAAPYLCRGAKKNTSAIVVTSGRACAPMIANWPRCSLTTRPTLAGQPRRGDRQPGAARPLSGRACFLAEALITEAQRFQRLLEMCGR